mmetsp:Transcript_24705/g.83352  ORF Transcript_24705/g.83352 Transcript_24705/m.83352 type:complete len:701 (+) Transcript_24705:66-2168(+)
MRVNCLDCLNRTNLMLAAFGLHAASAQLRELASALALSSTAEQVARACEPALLASLQQMWSATGDAVSMQYAGTANIGKGSASSLQPEASGKRSLIERAKGTVQQGRIAVNRYVHETFLEDGRQAAIESLLGGAVTPAALRRSSTLGSSGGGGARVRLWVGTWNVNGKICSEALLSEWFRNGAQCELAVPDIYSIGFQEFVDLTARNVLSDDVSRRKECATRVEAVLTSLHGERYVAVGMEQCVGVLLMVYVHPRLVGAVTHVRADVIKCGFGVGDARAGNKGGTAVRMAVHGSQLCLINAHLPAGASHADERNDTFDEIVAGLQKAYGERLRGGPFPSPLEHDLCVFAGDLNYRLEPGGAKEEQNQVVRDAVAQGNWGKLLQIDQLRAQQRAGLAFQGFAEASIDFQPTYKYDAGTSRYDSSEKQRVPSYCDRVLWLEPHGAACKPVAYVACQGVLVSDHKPVTALLDWSAGSSHRTSAESAASPAQQAAEASLIDFDAIDLDGDASAPPPRPSAESGFADEFDLSELFGFSAAVDGAAASATPTSQPAAFDPPAFAAGGAPAAYDPPAFAAGGAPAAGAAFDAPAFSAGGMGAAMPPAHFPAAGMGVPMQPAQPAQSAAFDPFTSSTAPAFPVAFGGGGGFEGGMQGGMQGGFGGSMLGGAPAGMQWATFSDAPSPATAPAPGSAAPAAADPFGDLLS